MIDPPPATDLQSSSRREHIAALRDRLRELSPDRPTGLAEIRSQLHALSIEAAGQIENHLVKAFERLALLTEVWECLAAEGSEAAAQTAAFCLRALAFIATEPADSDSSWILEESSTRWSDYLALIDPDGAGGDEDQSRFLADSPCEETQAEDPLPEIDAATLVRMLTGVAPTVHGGASERPPRSSPQREETIPAPTPPAVGLPGSAPSSGWNEANSVVSPMQGSTAVPETERVPLADPSPLRSSAASKRARPSPDGAIFKTTIPDIDPECREAFLTESMDLFERIETLVLSLTNGQDHASTLHELGRCFHTLKGAAGSVGLDELASRVHLLEGHLEESGGQINADLLDMLHESTGHLEGVINALRRGPSPEVASVSSAARRDASDERLNDLPRRSPPLEKAFPASDGPLPLVEQEPADGPVRISAGRIDELMDVASELIHRRGVWTAQAARLKELASLIRACRNELQVRLDQLDELGFTRAMRLGHGERDTDTDRPRTDAEPLKDLATVVLCLAEQVEDLGVLAESVQAQALPLADESDALARLTLQLWEALQSIRIVPIRGLFQRLARVAHDAARVEGRSVELVMMGDETGLDRAVQDKAFEPLLHIVRNAVGHGIEPSDERMRAGKAAVGRLTLEARREGNTLLLSVQDDGRGLDYEAIAAKARRLGLLGPEEAPTSERLSALIFLAGFSTRQQANAISGRGVGMDVVAQEVRRLRGTIKLTSKPGEGTRLLLRLPARLSLEQAMIARVSGQLFAIPVALIEHAQSFEAAEVERTGSGATVLFRDRRVPLIVAREALGFTSATPASCPKLLLVRADDEGLALLFDSIEGTRELVIKPLGPLLAGHPVIWGTSLSLTGEIIFVLNPTGLFNWSCGGRRTTADARDEVATRRATVLVVDDSISVRRVVTRQLRMLGLEVEEVSNGVEALSKLSKRTYSMILTDLEMPRMDGFELLAELRRSPALSSLPVVVASTESRPATRRRALSLGARAFVAKPIDQDELARVAEALLNENPARS